MARTVRDLARLLDVMVGYDPEDPFTAMGVGQTPSTYSAFLDAAGLKGARIGVLREPMGQISEPDSEDFAKVTRVFDRAMAEMQAAGATVVDPIVIPQLMSLLGKRRGGGADDSFREYYGRGGNPPFKTRQEMLASPDYVKVFRRGAPSIRDGGRAEYCESLAAREELMINILKVMADHNLDAIVHKTVEHQPTLIKEGINPPYYNSRGATHLNTYLVCVPSISVPAGFTSDQLPVGITFLGRPYTDGAMIKLAYAYEQATGHRTAPTSTPPLPGEP
jgi:Asp-tRNA(Asn)/Glu-tRNA(Gln) amidotransferase A subunit family amidase